MARISCPQANSFGLSQGAIVDKPELRNVLKSALLPFHRCPEARLTPRPRELKSACKDRQRRQFQINQDRAFNGVVDALKAQWPCEIPSVPASESSVEFRTYIDMGKAMQYVKPKFKSLVRQFLFRRVPSSDHRYTAAPKG